MTAPEKAGLSVRKVGPEAVPLIRRLADVAFPATYRDILSPGQLAYMMDWMYAEASLLRQMEQEGHVYFVAESDGEPCAYVSVQPRGLQEEGDLLFELQKIYVLPSFQGRGIGRQLYAQVCRFVRDAAGNRPCRIELHVNRQNPAVDFYRHLGMEILREGDFPIGNGYYMNDYIMGVSL